MSSTACPQRDGGICNIPDPAVLVSQGQFSLLRADIVRRLYPDLETRSLRDLELHEEVRYPELVASVASSLAPALALAGRDEPDDFETQERMRVLSLVASSVGGNGGVLVNCSCGHIFTV